ncbi:MAG: dihydroorotate dehydrogenase [Bacillota bacterium]
MARTEVALGPLTLKNPVMPASGTFGYGEENAGAFDPGELGAVVAKSVRLEPAPGNPPPRLVETPAGLINAVGIPSEGVDAFIRDQMPLLRQTGTVVIVSIAGSTAPQYGELAARLSKVPGIDALELNLSCPNIGHGLPFAQDPGLLAEAVSAARSNTGLPIIAKMSPNVTDIAAMSKIALDAGADILAIANTVNAMVIDIWKRQPVLGNVAGGLSGPAIRPIAVRNVWRVYEQLEAPIIGSGGIATWQDAVEFLLAGARAVAVGVANFINPNAMKEIIEGIQRYLDSQGFESVEDIIGLAHAARRSQ